MALAQALAPDAMMRPSSFLPRKSAAISLSFEGFRRKRRGGVLVSHDVGPVLGDPSLISDFGVLVNLQRRSHHRAASFMSVQGVPTRSGLLVDPLLDIADQKFV